MEILLAFFLLSILIIGPIALVTTGKATKEDNLN